MCDSGDTTADPEVPELWTCTTCYKWVQGNLPDTAMRELYDEKEQDKEAAVEIEAFVSKLQTEDPESTSSVVSGDGIPLSFSDAEKVSFEFVEEYDLFTYTDYMETVKSTPAAMGAKPINRVDPKTGERKVLYACPTKKRTTLRVTQKRELSVKKDKLKGNKIREAFSKHGKFALKSAVKRALTEAGIYDLSLRQSCLNDLIRRSQRRNHCWSYPLKR